MNLAANLRDQIRHSIPAVIVVVIGAWVMIYYSIVQWETMKQVPSWDLAIFSEMAKAYAHLQAPIVPVKGDGFNLLGDHFHPILILLGINLVYGFANPGVSWQAHIGGFLAGAAATWALLRTSGRPGGTLAPRAKQIAVCVAMAAAMAVLCAVSYWGVPALYA